jgi:hypothetical protein
MSLCRLRSSWQSVPIEALSTDLPTDPPAASTMTSVRTNDMATTCNGWTNYETWNAALWIGNDEFLYNTAKACVTYCADWETPWEKFVRCMTEGQIGRHLLTTGDGVRWDDEAINEEEMIEMMQEL